MCRPKRPVLLPRQLMLSQSGSPGTLSSTLLISRSKSLVVLGGNSHPPVFRGLQKFSRAVRACAFDDRHLIHWHHNGALFRCPPDWLFPYSTKVSLRCAASGVLGENTAQFQENHWIAPAAPLWLFRPPAAVCHQYGTLSAHLLVRRLVCSALTVRITEDLSARCGFATG